MSRRVIFLAICVLLSLLAGAAAGEMTLAGHTSLVLSVSWSPDGSKLASGSWDKTVRIWDGSTGATLRTLTGHTDTVLSVAWSPDGKKVASGSADITVRIWDVSSAPAATPTSAPVTTSTPTPRSPGFEAAIALAALAGAGLLYRRRSR